MRPADLAAVGRIEGAVFGRKAWPPSAFAFAREVFTAARPPRGQLWVAMDEDGRVVGYTGLEMSVLGGEADLINLAVEPGQRCRGVGRRLVGAAVAYCRAQRIPLVWLRVRASNRGARAFYHRCGFEAVGRFHGYYEDPAEDAVLMALVQR